MAVNPKELIKMAPKKRVQLLKQSPQLLQEMMLTGALTPTERALLFPDYFKRTIPEHMRTGTGIRPTPADHGTGGRPDRMGTTPDTPATSPRGGYTDAYQKPEKKTTINVASTPAAMGATPDTPVIQVDRSHLEQGGKGLQDIMPSGMHPSLKQFEAAPATRELPKLDAGSRGDLGYTQNDSLTPRQRALLDAIATDSGGGYGTVNYVAKRGGATDVEDLSQGHPFEGKKGYTAAGRYQMLSTNYTKFAKKLGLYDEATGKSDFSMEAQDKIAYEMAKDVYRKGTGGRSLDDDIKDPNVNTAQLIQPLSIDYGWHILKTRKGMSRAIDTMDTNQKIYEGLPEQTAKREIDKTDIPGGVKVTAEQTLGQKLDSSKVTSGPKNLSPTDDEVRAFWNERNPRGSKLFGKDGKFLVNKDLLIDQMNAIKTFEAKHPDKRVEMFGPSGGARTSGSTGNHGMQKSSPLDAANRARGGATDIVITDRNTGRQLTNYNRPYAGQEGKPSQTAPLYQELYNETVIAGAARGSNWKNYRFGGYFASGDTHTDLMHTDVRGHRGTAQGDLYKGFTTNRLGIKSGGGLGSEENVMRLAQERYGSGSLTAEQPQPEQSQTAERIVPKPRPKPAQLTADKSVVPLAPGQPTTPVATPAPQTQTAPQQQTMQQPPMTPYPGNPNDGPRPSVSEPTVDQALLNNRQPQMPKAAASAYARAQLNSGASPYSKFDSIGGLPSFLA